MKCRLVKLSNLSGNAASVYSILLNDAQKTLFEIFIEENINLFLSEIKDITVRLKTIGQKTGARETFFKHFEGKPGDGVCALYDLPDKSLRLYCIRYGSQIVILGGGGPKKVRALQDNNKLTEENYFLRWLSSQITERLKSKEITFTKDGLDFYGNLEFNDDEEESRNS
ncbi:MAG: hypothetical protein ACFCUU_09635 [Cyclobacteriaceae bacterium]